MAKQIILLKLSSLKIPKSSKMHWICPAGTSFVKSHNPMLQCTSPSFFHIKLHSCPLLLKALTE